MTVLPQVDLEVRRSNLIVRNSIYIVLESIDLDIDPVGGGGMGIQITLTVVGLGVLWEAPRTELGLEGGMSS